MQSIQLNNADFMTDRQAAPAQKQSRCPRDVRRRDKLAMSVNVSQTLATDIDRLRVESQESSKKVNLRRFSGLMSNTTEARI